MPRILYLSTIPPPAIAGTEAVLQTISSLRQANGGAHLSLFPFQRPSRWVPAWMMGWRQRRELMGLAAEAEVIHVFNATLRPLACLNRLSRPVVYTVTAAIGKRIPERWLRQLDVTVVVNNERDRERLQRIDGLRTVLVRPGLDLSRFTYQQPSADESFRLLVGSAPWTRAQFRTKGIDALIAAARQLPWLHLVFLWRDLGLPQLEQRLDQAGIRERTTIHNTRTDVNALLAGCHATVVLAANDRLVKAWPHSAIESLAAGRPVLLSGTIAMSDYIERQQAGIGIPAIETKVLTAAIQSLKAGIGLQPGKRLAATATHDFGLAPMLASYRQLYKDAG